jgi:tellurite resistance protein
MFAVVAPKVFRPSVTFSPGWWAIGFPMAALVNAALRYADFLASGPLLFLAGALLIALSLALTILTVRTVKVALSGELFT